MYCVKCKKQTETKDMQKAKSRDARPMARGVCNVCGTTKNTIREGKRRRIVSSLNMITSNTKLPRGKFPGEMHLPAVPGHQFTGPETRLEFFLTVLLIRGLHPLIE